MRYTSEEEAERSDEGHSVRGVNGSEADYGDGWKEDGEGLGLGHSKSELVGLETKTGLGA